MYSVTYCTDALLVHHWLHSDYDKAVAQYNNWKEAALIKYKINYTAEEFQDSNGNLTFVIRDSKSYTFTVIKLEKKEKVKLK